MGADDAPDWAIILTAISGIVFAILGFFGNLLTILALPYSTRLRNAATWFVVNLAFVEGLFCVTILPISAAHLFSLYVSDEKLFSSKGCSVFVFLRYLIIQTELLSIAAIAVNRCILIGIPRMYPKLFTTPKTIITIVMIWVLSAGLMLIPLLKIYGEFTYNPRTKECDFADIDGDTGPRKLFLMLGFLLPCVVIIASYSYIFYKARKSSAKVQSGSGRGRSLLKGSSTNSTVENRTNRPVEGLRKRDIRIARTIGVIFLAFLMCCSPVSIAHFSYNKYPNPTLLLLLHPVYWAQYCINVFIYVFMNKQYRDAYVNYISRWWPNFKEMSVRKFKWREEATSNGGSNRQTRAETPNSTVRFAARKVSKSSSFKMTQSPLAEGSRKPSQEESPKVPFQESLLEETPEVVDTAL